MGGACPGHLFDVIILGCWTYIRNGIVAQSCFETLDMFRKGLGGGGSIVGFSSSLVGAAIGRLLQKCTYA